jgi:hypothetical protein
VGFDRQFGGGVGRTVCTNGPYRRLEVAETCLFERELATKLASPAGQAIYARRRVLVEPVFGHFKHNLGFTCFSLRGLAKVKGEFLLLCIAHNLKKLARWSADGRGLTPLRTVLRRLWACIVRRITHSRTFWFTMTTNQPMTATVRNN